MFALIKNGKFLGRVWNSVDNQTILHHQQYNETIHRIGRELQWSEVSEQEASGESPKILSVPTKEELSDIVLPLPTLEERIAQLESEIANLKNDTEGES